MYFAVISVILLHLSVSGFVITLFNGRGDAALWTQLTFSDIPGPRGTNAGYKLLRE